MTMHDLLNKGLIQDTDQIKVIQPLTGHLFNVRRGHWFNDHILDFHNAEITEFSWNRDKGWLIAIEPLGN